MTATTLTACQGVTEYGRGMNLVRVHGSGCCARHANAAADRRDAYLMHLFARLQLTVRGRHLILSGIAGFNRSVTE